MRTFQDLPVELITKIHDYLDFNARNEFAFACHVFHLIHIRKAIVGKSLYHWYELDILSALVSLPDAASIVVQDKKKFKATNSITKFYCAYYNKENFIHLYGEDGYYHVINKIEYIEVNYRYDYHHRELVLDFLLKKHPFQQLGLALIKQPRFTAMDKLRALNFAIKKKFNILVFEIIGQLNWPESKAGLTQDRQIEIQGFLNKALLQAANIGNLEVLKFLLDCQLADVNCVDENDLNPLMHSIREGHISNVKFLLNHSEIDVNYISKFGNKKYTSKMSSDYGCRDTSLTMAIEKSTVEVVALLLHHKNMILRFRDLDDKPYSMLDDENRLPYSVHPLLMANHSQNLEAMLLIYDFLWENDLFDLICDSLAFCQTDNYVVMKFIFNHPSPSFEFKKRLCDSIFRFGSNVECINVAVSYIKSYLEAFIKNCRKKAMFMFSNTNIKDAHLLLKHLEKSDYSHQKRYHYSEIISNNSPLYVIADLVDLLMFYARNRINKREIPSSGLIEILCHATTLLHQKKGG